MDTLALIRWINTQHGTSWTLAGKFSGGYQGGAYELIDVATGERAVLKCAFAPRAVPIVAQLRAVGYPTPAWLLHGTAPNDVPYVVQAFVPGAPMETLGAAYLDQILALNDLQADLYHEPGSSGRTESSYAYDVVFRNESGWAANMRAYSADTAHLLAALETAVRPRTATQLPDTDAVHGDFTPDNILMEDGRITGVIDCTYASYGSRAIDLATLLHYGYSFDYGEVVRTRLRDRVVELVGLAGLTIVLAYRSMAMIDWAIGHGTADAVRFWVAGGWRALADLQR